MAFTFGLAHAPVTPFRDGRVDTDLYRKVLDFHLAQGAGQVALPTHSGESVSLTNEERKSLLELAIAHVAGRATIVANVSEAGTALACSLASHAAKAGAVAIYASVPYYWTPPQSMLVEHFSTIAKAGDLPFFVLNAPDEMNEVEIAPKSVVDLLRAAPNFAGLIDTSLDWQYMIEVVTVARAVRPEFQLVSGTEYMISAAAIGATGLMSPAASLVPKLVQQLYALCRAERFTEARPLQERAAIVYRALKEHGPVAIKAGLKTMSRDCGKPRPPLSELAGADVDAIATALAEAGILKSEPRGW